MSILFNHYEKKDITGVHSERKKLTLEVLGVK